MRKRRSNTLIVCLLFLLFVVVHHLILSPFSRIKIRGNITSKLKKIIDPNPPLSSSLKSHPTRKISCDRTDKFYDLCTVDGPTVMEPTTSTFYLMDPKSRAEAQPPYAVEKIRPYPRKWETIAMRKIREISITSDPRSPPCQIHHNLPALVFSLGGSLGNIFFEFIEGLIPLFITVNYVFPPGQEFILVIANSRGWWVNKYSDLLQAFSKHPVINLDNATSIHCFPSATVGLISHGYMSIDPTLLPTPKTFSDFHDFLARAFGNNPTPHPDLKLASPTIRPGLVLMSRNGSVGRVLLNEIDVKQMAQEIGFDVTIFGPHSVTQLREAYELMRRSHAMVGVHGSALTYSLFLRPGSVFLQVVPLGIEEVADVYYGNSAREIGLDYTEYKIGVEESTLIYKYEKSSLMIQDPVAYIGKNWSYALMDTYRNEQDVRLDLVRFRECLVRVYDRAKKFMDKEG